ncbi:hypothetical protein LEP1GSC195_1473 [Leptospira wolbachii serovar Codice str. CDC]|uniref:RiboL-PSP-HEPN domain-containing protein n=1 Tax=Leptospira wolbachii serovar Codice str. CDC TaxID=1218599 RepID=R9A8D2_9LEPT|nr:hypothetical protein [Leptospira wolbachii]EOQ98284.1 hypothetical protein LEP1GSC195_1473 [Leptospira wolbachii serovar Codice str. CDC]
MVAKKKMQLGRPRKKIQDYIIESNSADFGKMSDYYDYPVKTFLNFLCISHYAVDYCKTKFPKNADKKMGVEAQRHLNIIILSILPTIMGQFETFQKSLFSKCLEYSVYLDNFVPSEFLKRLKDIQSLEIDSLRLTAYRGQPAQVGTIFADSLHIWHDSHKVSHAFRALTQGVDFYTKDQIEELQIIWQLRHSIVHTGGTITRPDSQKNSKLKKFADKSIILSETFISTLGYKLHNLINNSITRYSSDFKGKLSADTPIAVQREIDSMFKVESKMQSSWIVP